MAVQQGLVEVTRETDQGLGTSATTRLRSIYSGSPLLSDLSDAERREWFQTNVLDAVINDGGHTFGQFNTSYSDSPNINDVETGGAGAPASPHVPNPVSPGAGSVNPSDQTAAPENFGTVRSDVPFTGPGSQLDPSVSSEAISAQRLGDLNLGSSS
jgi:hypothetical protein